MQEECLGSYLTPKLLFYSVYVHICVETSGKLLLKVIRCNTNVLHYI